MVTRSPLTLLLAASSCLLASPGLAQARRTVEQPALEDQAASSVRLEVTTDVLPTREPTSRRARRHRRSASPRTWADINAGVSEVFYRFFGNIAPSSSGVERPSVDEHMYDAVVAPLGSQLSYVILGAGNNHVLSSTYFYQQYDGIAGVRYHFVPTSAGSPFQFSLTGSPLHASLSSVTRHMGVVDQEQEAMPQAMLVGGAVGLDFTYTSDAVCFEARAYAMPEVDTGHSHAAGVSQMQSLQLVFPLTELFHGRPDLHFDLYFVGMHIERGEARAAIYGWSAQGFRPVSDLRELYQAMIVLTIRHD